MSPHLDDETLAAWTADAITEDERERAIEHVAGCAACRAVVGALVGSEATPARIGRYEIRGSLGAGGMGVVLRAHDAALGRDVAIKMIKSTLIEPAHRERMLREAQAMAAVTHPNVVTVHELGEAGDELYVAMAHVDGTMLQRWLAEPRSRAARAAVALGIGRGIAAVHAAGLLHRDIKPDNILVRADGTPVLVDFGLARAQATPVFGAGSGIAGTPRYLAPEVAAGAPASAASDQYQWWTVVDDLLGKDARVARLVARGHDRDPARRFSSMTAAVDALAIALVPRTKLVALGALGVIVATVAVVALAWPESDDCAQPPPKAWSAERRASAAKNLAAAGLDPARILAAIDDRAATTRALRVRACREIAKGGNTRAEWTRRQVCLDETWAKAARELDAMVGGSPADVREAADDLVEVLPVTRCERGGLPASPLPIEGEPRRRYHALVARMQALEGENARTPAQRGEALRALGTEIEALGYLPLEARWHWAIAHTLNDAGDVKGSAAAFDRAAQVALAAGDDDVYVRASISSLRTSAGASEERIAGIEAAATAGARRLGNPQVDAQLVAARAHLAMERGDNAKARTLFAEADARFTKIAIAPMLLHMAVLQNLGAIALEAGDLTAAETALDRAVEIARGRFSTDGASYWEARAARAVLLLAKRDFAKAETELTAAAEGLERTTPASGQAGFTRAYLCVLLRAQKKYAEARAACDASIASMTKVIGPDGAALVWPLTLRGQVETAANAFADGIPYLRRAVALAAKHPVRPIEAIVAKAQLAIALYLAGEKAEGTALAKEVAPRLAAPELAETLVDFKVAFPSLAP